MKALVKTAVGAGHLEYSDLPDPSPKPGEVKIKVYASGICGTDMHIFHGGYHYEPPVALGHEFSGEIVELGEGVSGFKPGDRVSAEAPTALCGTCEYCRSGDYQLCTNRLGVGWGTNGSFAEYIVVEADFVHAIPYSISDDDAALLEPLACVCHGVNELTSISVNDFVVLSGPGPIGLLTLQAAKAEGARVAVLGTNQDKDRMKLALELGADYIINVQEQDAREEIKKITGGTGADVVLECSGSEAAFDLDLDLIKKAGRFTQIGIYDRKITADIDKMLLKEIRFVGSFSQKYSSWVRAIDLMSRGLVKVDKIVSAKLPLSEWKKGFEMIENKTGMKVLLVP